MKKIILFFICCMVIAHSGIAADHTTNPKDYTIDMREYVDWNTAPYNSIVQVAILEGGHCTGTMTTGKKILTAAHCGKSLEAAGQMRFINHLRTIYKAEKFITGEGVANSRDWSIISVKDPNNQTPSIRISSHLSGDADVKTVGFGGMKILSDKEIQQVRKAYVKYLDNSEGFDMSSRISRFIAFFNSELDVYAYYADTDYIKFKNSDEYKAVSDIFLSDANNLKSSNCNVSFNSSNILSASKCQNWGGDSGGPMLYKDESGTWNLVGINVTGFYQISNNKNDHAAAGKTVAVSAFRNAYIDFNRNAVQVNPYYKRLFEAGKYSDAISEIKKELNDTNDSATKYLLWSYAATCYAQLGDRAKDDGAFGVATVNYQSALANLKLLPDGAKIKPSENLTKQQRINIISGKLSASQANRR
ncbi:hypothetical protein FACS18945_3140 [Bacteroidia bacterium]|nr:hypothetical protein FACS18945_3140 [Bacteroidia bacterium]